MKRGRMQCKDIPNTAVIQAVMDTRETVGPGNWRLWRDLAPQLDLALPDIPHPLILAKIDRMARAGLIHACVHRPYNGPQCRGDVHLPEECRGC